MKTVEGYQPKEEFSKKALIDTTKYHEMYKRSIESPEAFWEEEGRNRLLWQKEFTKVKNVSYSHPDTKVKKWRSYGRVMSQGFLKRLRTENSMKMCVSLETF